MLILFHKIQRTARQKFLTLSAGDIQQCGNLPAVDEHGNFTCSALYQVPYIGKRDLVPLIEQVHIGRIFENQRQYAEIDQIGLVNAGKTFDYLGANPEITGRNGGMFTGRTLPVVFAADDDTVSCRLGACRKFGIQLFEDMLADGRNVAAQWQHLVAGRHDMVGRNVVAQLDNNLSLQ